MMRRVVQVERQGGEQPTGVARMQANCLTTGYNLNDTARTPNVQRLACALPSEGARKDVENRHKFEYLPAAPFRP